MKKLLIAIALIATASLLRAQSPSAPEQTESLVASGQPVNDIYPRWTIIGEWRVTHPHWTDLVTLSADGSLTTSRQQTTGKWLLTADAGTPIIVFRWDLYGTESVAMVGPNHFRGQ